MRNNKIKGREGIGKTGRFKRTPHGRIDKAVIAGN